MNASDVKSLEEATKEATYEMDPEVIRRDISGYAAQIEEMILNHKQTDLADLITDLHPSDLADIIQSIGFDEACMLFRKIPVEQKGETIYEMPEVLALKFLNDVLTPDQIALSCAHLPSDVIADILGLLKVNRVGDVLVHLSFKERSQILELLSYPDDTAGALMDKGFVAVQDHQSIHQAIATLRRAGRDINDVHTIYVIDEHGRYKGNVGLSKMILARPQSKIKRIMEADIPPIPVAMDQEEVAVFFTKYNIITAPVIDEHGIMLGRITVDDILEVVHEEASEDILRMGGVSGEETLDTPVWKSSLQRITWLVLNLGTAFVSAGVVKFFEHTISHVVILAVLMPIVAGMGGNAGSQTMTLVVRNLALGELTVANRWKTLGREFSIGLLNGLTIGLLTGLIVYLLTSEFVLSIIMATALLVNLVIAAIAGSILPLLLQKMKVDPAIASGILVTTCTDSMGFFIFLGLAWLMIPYLT